MLIDVHAHFLHDRTPRADWRERNASRLRAGDRVGITVHVASILGSWGHSSPTYFPSPADLTYGNDFLLGLAREAGGRIRGYAAVNPNYTDHALAEIARCLDAGMIGIKLAASRRADDPLLDPVCRLAAARGVPVLHHVWQHRRRDHPGQEASDGRELAALAARHPSVRFILAHIGGGGDWLQTLPLLPSLSNVLVDLSGSGVDGGMLEACLEAVGPERLVWGCDLTIET
ncbi:MAG TPA: amidohydrolase family protein, partial [Gemmatimonadales bacterium]|nr:amidohydrolase family protein [Gemmatimonadales bacterium]